jgi:hypothetical protein
MVKRFTKTCRRSLTKLAGMASTATQNPKSTSLRGKLANSGPFVQDFGVHSAGNFLAKELA